MNVAAFMSPDPLVVTPDTSVDTAFQLMDERAIRHLPVVDGGSLVGLISDRDLLSASGWRLPEPRRKAAGKSTAVAEVMHRGFVSVWSTEEAMAAAIEVVVHGIGCLPVLERAELVGIITEMDLLGLYLRLCRERALGGDLDPPVGEIAGRDAVVITPEATLAQADELCHAKGFHHLPVLDGGELVGILSDRDLRRAVGDGHAADTTVATLMSGDVVTIAHDAPLSDAAEKMVEHHFSSLPVTGGGYLGIVTSTDILERVAGALSELEEDG